MWCPSCHQDVPAVVSDHAQSLCVRCGEPLRSATKTSGLLDMGVDLSSNKEEKAQHVPFGSAEWDLRERMQRIERLLSRQLDSSRPHVAEDSDAATTLAISPPDHVEPGSVQSTVNAKVRGRHPHLPSTEEDGMGWTIATIVLTLLLLTLAWFCTPVATLLGGTPWRAAILVGMGLVALIGLMAGVLLVRAILRREKRMNQQIDALASATSRLAHTTSSRSRLFYQHAAESASPHILLADVRGQLDLLTTQILTRQDR